MKSSFVRSFSFTALACCAMFAISQTGAFAGDKTVMHCFAWTPVKEATPADWDAFYKASDLLPKKIKGIKRVWYGKLAAPLSQTGLVKPESAAFAKYQAGETVDLPTHRVAREYGMCMEMTDAAVLKAYGTDPYHKIWTDAYAKIRVDGTTTFNILGQ
jgi:hypothetical protein